MIQPTNNFGSFQVGNLITGTGIVANTVITAINGYGPGMLVVLSNAASTSATNTTTMTGDGYQTTDDSAAVANGYASSTDDRRCLSVVAGAAPSAGQVVTLKGVYVQGLIASRPPRACGGSGAVAPAVVSEDRRDGSDRSQSASAQNALLMLGGQPINDPQREQRSGPAGVESVAQVRNTLRRHPWNCMGQGGRWRLTRRRRRSTGVPVHVAARLHARAGGGRGRCRGRLQN